MHCGLELNTGHTMIQVENLTKYYGLKPAIQDISLEIERGKILGLLGPNGAGKTTILRILTCFMQPSSTRLYDIRAVNTIVLEGYGRSHTVRTPSEEGITNGLIRLSRDETHMCYWVTGHGERLFHGGSGRDFSMLREAMEKENFRFEELSLMTRDIPEDASIVVVAAPEKPLFPEEIESLRRFAG